jgi:hypothetical protein
LREADSMEVIILSLLPRYLRSTILRIPILSTNFLQVHIIISILPFYFTFLDTLFIGMQKTIVTCGKCQNRSITYNPFMTLSLAFESSLEKALAHFLKEDILNDGKESYKCENCK